MASGCLVVGVAYLFEFMRKLPIRHPQVDWPTTNSIDELVILHAQAIHDTEQHANNRAEQPHEPTRVGERGMVRLLLVARNSYDSTTFGGEIARWFSCNKLAR